ncbi:MAG: EamA family transporter [Actinobacteria bacterium]|nr:EamA family transporter [Actinomycetota bacterium]
MSPLALALVVTGAVLHATWNLSAKRASDGDSVAFVWLMSVVSMGLALPFGLVSWAVDPPSMGLSAWIAVVASGVVHGVYFLLLQLGYRHGDLSVVYPVARGTGPLFAVAAAVLLFGERPGVAGSVGIGAVLVGIVLVSGLVSAPGSRKRSAGVGWGTLTGLWIATYTVIDAWAVTSLGLSPLVFFLLSLVLTAVVMAPFALREPACLGAEWRQSRRQIVTVGILSPVAFTLVLFALRLAPLAYVAPLREVSMMVGVFYGAWVLRERVTATRLAGVLCMIAGVVAFTLA